MLMDHSFGRFAWSTATIIIVIKSSITLNTTGCWEDPEQRDGPPFIHIRTLNIEFVEATH